MWRVWRLQLGENWLMFPPDAGVVGRRFGAANWIELKQVGSWSCDTVNVMDQDFSSLVNVLLNGAFLFIWGYFIFETNFVCSRVGEVKCEMSCLSSSHWWGLRLWERLMAFRALPGKVTRRHQPPATVVWTTGTLFPHHNKLGLGGLFFPPIALFCCLLRMKMFERLMNMAEVKGKTPLMLFLPLSFFRRLLSLPHLRFFPT